MLAKKKPAHPGERVAGQINADEIYRHHHITKKRKLQHWSRNPIQIRKDRALLAIFGLGFHQTKSGFHTFKKIDATELEIQGVLHGR